MMILASVLTVIPHQEASAITGSECKASGGTWVAGKGICEDAGQSAKKRPDAPVEPTPVKGTTFPLPCAPKGSGDPLKGLGTGGGGGPSPCPTAE
jgi:hypothetical protein